MTELAISFFISLIGGGAGISVVVFALSKWLGSVWKERIGRLEDAKVAIETLQEQASIDTVARDHAAGLEERLKLLEQDYDRRSTKDEHFHQISQETYQTLFNRKLNLTEELADLVWEYDEEIPISIEMPDSHESVFFQRYLKINQHIRKNSLFFSPDLVQTNLELHKKIRPLLEEYYLNRQIDMDNEPLHDIAFDYRMHKAKDEKFKFLFNQFQDIVENLLEMSNKEIIAITMAVNQKVSFD